MPSAAAASASLAPPLHASRATLASIKNREASPTTLCASLRMRPDFLRAWHTFPLREPTVRCSTPATLNGCTFARCTPEPCESLCPAHATNLRPIFHPRAAWQVMYMDLVHTVLRGPGGEWFRGLVPGYVRAKGAGAAFSYLKRRHELQLAAQARREKRRRRRKRARGG